VKFHYISKRCVKILFQRLACLEKWLNCRGRKRSKNFDFIWNKCKVYNFDKWPVTFSPSTVTCWVPCTFHLCILSHNPATALYLQYQKLHYKPSEKKKNKRNMASLCMKMIKYQCLGQAFSCTDKNVSSDTWQLKKKFPSERSVQLQQDWQVKELSDYKMKHINCHQVQISPWNNETSVHLGRLMKITITTQAEWGSWLWLLIMVEVALSIITAAY
jgi:hypothetical protein